MLKKKQELALNAMRQGRNTFLTGEAGSGKSFVIKQYTEELEKEKKDVVICAPTGLAALNIGGSTIHRTFKAPIGALTSSPYRVPDPLESADVIIIDEISMCRSDLFSWVAKCIRLAEEKREKKIQLIVIGDFYQLPPVLTDDDQRILGYKDAGLAFAFEAPEWEEFDFVTISLDEVVRQNDIDFISNLNKARIGDKDCVKWFNNNAAKEVQKGVYLCGKREQAKEINRTSLEKLSTKLYHFKSEEVGKVTEQDRPTEKDLELRVGARIMMVRNGEGYSNGSLGEILDISSNVLTIKLDEGKVIDVAKYEWEIVEFRSTRRGLKKDVIGRFKQFPVKLAYAITIHKSQGQTYDSVNIYPSCFADGQLYVALSRCKSLETLHLMEDIKPSSLLTSSHVKSFFEKEAKKKQYTGKASKGGKREGAGRKQKYKCKTVTMRVPEGMVDKIKEFIAEQLEQQQEE